MRESFEKVKTFLIIVTAPLWILYLCFFMMLFFPFYLIYFIACRIAYAYGYAHSYPEIYSRGPWGVGFTRHYRYGHGPNDVFTTYGKK